MPQAQLSSFVADPAKDADALAAVIEDMMPRIRVGARKVVCPGLEFDDAVQEGLIGLLRAVASYRADKAASFQTYAGVCIQNAQLDARRAALRKKHSLLNLSVPLSHFSDEELLPGPDEQLICREELESAMGRMSTRLSPKERSVMEMYLDGKGCKQIAQSMRITPKAVETALRRARAKLRSN